MAFIRALGASILGYTTFIEYNRYLQKQDIEKYTYNKKQLSESILNLSSSESLVLDNVNTGDIILFSRRWYNYHIPMALAISLYQVLYDTDFDHCGIIVIKQDGLPYIVELSPFKSSWSIKRLDDRIANSKSHQILLIRLENIEFNLSRLNLTHNTLKSFQDSDARHDMECLGILTGITNSMLKKIFRNIYPNFMIDENKHYNCPNSKFVKDLYNNIGLTVSLSNQSDDESSCNDMTIQSFYRRNILISFKNLSISTINSQNISTRPLTVNTQVKLSDANILITMK